MLKKADLFTKILISVIFIISLFLINITFTFGNERFFDENFPKIEGFSALAIEKNTGRVLYYKNMEEKIFPASTTKILTAILAYQHLDLDQLITVPQDYILPQGTKINVKSGEILTIKDLIAGLMIVSGNDCAELLAINISGSIPEFAKLMNQKAREIGCISSNFTNPSGLPDKNHYSTALDMSKIAAYYMDIPVLFQISNTKNYTIANTNLSSQRDLLNTNRFFRNEKVVIGHDEFILNQENMNGIKTGYTGDAGRCLISSFEYEDQNIITLVFKSSLYGVYKDTLMIKNYIKENYTSFSIFEEGEIFERKYFLSLNNFYTDLYLKDAFKILISQKNQANIVTSPLYYELDFPINKGEKIGEIQIFDINSNILLSSVYLVSNEDINETEPIFIILLFLIFSLIFVGGYRLIKRK